MPIYGYARVSALDQRLAVQHAVIKVAGCEVIRAEKGSGTWHDSRTELQVLLDFVQPGDTMVVTRTEAALIRDAVSSHPPWRHR